MTDNLRTPPRVEQPGLFAFAAYVAVVAFFVVALSGTQASLGDLAFGLPQMARLVGEMLPPSTASWPSTGPTSDRSRSMAPAAAPALS